MSDFCKTMLKTNAQGVDVSKAALDVSQLGAAHAFLHVMIGKAKASISTTADADLAADKLISHKALVLEGVAGIGKSFAINGIRNHLLQQLIVSNLTTLLKDVRDLLLKWPNVTTAEVDSVVDRLKALPTTHVPVTLILLHPSSTYEDIIGGIRLVGGECKWLPGTLTRACENAQAKFDDAQYHLVVLDELNRCNVPSVLGESMLLIEASRRIPSAEAAALGLPAGLAHDEWLATGRAVGLPSSRSMLDNAIYKDSRIEEHGCYSLWLPNNLLILGTINSSDRSILGFDQALRRRFPPMRLEPHPLTTWLKELDTLNGGAVPEHTHTWLALLEILEWAQLNVLLRAVLGPDAMIGHSYFYPALRQFNGPTADFQAALSDAWQFGILPQIIHSAEAYRSETFIEHLFTQPLRLQGATNDDKLENLRSSLTALGLPVSQLFVSQCEMHGVTHWSTCRRHTLESVGRDHAVRLLITPIEGHRHNDVVNGHREEVMAHLADGTSGKPRTPDWVAAGPPDMRAAAVADSKDGGRVDDSNPAEASSEERH